MPQDGSPCRTLNSHVECKNGNRITDDIDDCAGKHGNHGVFRTAIRSDDGSKRILCHGKGHHGKNDHTILVRHLYVCIRRANHTQQTFSPQIGNDNYHHTGQKRSKDRAANAPVNVLCFSAPQRNAQCGGRSVTKEKA